MRHALLFASLALALCACSAKRRGSAEEVDEPSPLQQDAAMSSPRDAGKTPPRDRTDGSFPRGDTQSDGTVAEPPMNAGPRLWTPSELSGLVLWLDGTKALSSYRERSVHMWLDQSHHLNHARPISSDGHPLIDPTGANGKPLVVFGLDDSAKLEIEDAPSLNWGGEDFALFMVARSEPQQDDHITLFQKGSGGHGPFVALQLGGASKRGSLTLWLSPADRGWVSTEESFDDGKLHLFAARRTGGTRLEARVDGVARAQQTTGRVIEIEANLEFEIGGYPGYSEQLLRGGVAEVVAVRGALDHSELAKLERYLLRKYELTDLNGRPEADVLPARALDPGTASTRDAGREPPPAGPAAACSGAGVGLTAFVPSNLGPLMAPSTPPSGPSGGGNCSIDTERFIDNGGCTGPYDPPPTWVTSVVTLADGREAAVLWFSDLTLEDMALQFYGRRPIILVATGSITILGELRTVPLSYMGPETWNAGGAPDPLGFARWGNAPISLLPGVGGGGPGGALWVASIGAGGGGYCGTGGTGSGPAHVTPAPGGKPYGRSDLIPLLGGSSGGSASQVRVGNAGGGALQLVAGKEIRIGPEGIVDLRGRYGDGLGAGAGSGGAILLEAPSIVVEGKLLADGGGGSGEEGRKEGAGSHGAQLDGVPGGRLQEGQTALGGGGGAGRIRINSCAPPQIASSAVISPELGTVCATLGPLRGP